jgi:hypothetical protein
MVKYKVYRKRPKVLIQKRYKKQRLIEPLSQVKNRKSVAKDKKYKALRPGRRVSRRGKEYTETRSNRSDKKKQLL